MGTTMPASRASMVHRYLTSVSYPHERRHYRVQYPTTIRPVLATEAAEYEVIDLSEGGLRYKPGANPTPAVGDQVEGTVRFKSGVQAPVRGKVVRHQGAEVALSLEVGVPLRVILDEQRFLLQSNRWLAP